MMAAYKLALQNKQLRVAIIERGKPVYSRECPAAKHNIPCAHCKLCDVVSGYAGAGAFSDGKFNLGTSYGGTLSEHIGEYNAMHYIKCVDNILAELCTDYPEVYPANEDLKLKCLTNNLQLLDMDTRHLGTDRNFVIMSALYHKLEAMGVSLISNEWINSVNSMFDTQGHRCYQLISDKAVYIASYVIFAVGRSGVPFLTSFYEQNNIKVTANAVDIGVRVQMKDAIWREFSNAIYEPKILCRTKTFEDKTRMFCFNKGGVVSVENNDGIITANGHAFSAGGKKTDNCNFAILTSIHFTEPFNQPTDYAQHISSLANMIGKGNVLVQRFGDLVRGRRTNDHRLAQNSVKPTLAATPGDISLVLPHRILVDIIETIEALDKVAPGTANDDTLLYACESKYYSVKPQMDEHFQILPNVFVVGDGSGVCRGLSQSGAMGLCVADYVGELVELSLGAYVDRT